MVAGKDGTDFETVAYVSFDGGKSWTLAVRPDIPGFSTQDPACLYGLDGSAYFVSWGYDRDNNYKMLLHRSSDGGKTWLTPTELLTLDREYLTIDRSNGKYRGWSYVYGQRGIFSIDGKRTAGGLIILRSSDGGATFPLFSVLLSDPPAATLAPANSVVLSDGTLVLLFEELKVAEDAKFNPITRAANTWLKVVTSNDGGEYFSAAAQVAELAVDWGNDVTVVPSLAADASTGPYRDRLYAAWTDIRSGKARVLLSYSSDKGKSWSESVEIDDDLADSGWGKGPDCFRPVVAVNSQGVVGVMWYDRRENKNDDRGWWTRFAVSLDGGETFQPSVKVSEAPSHVDPAGQLLVRAWGNESRSKTQPPPTGPLHGDIVIHGFNFFGGHTAGLDTDANGAFHPLWVDNRTGIPQVWTATVVVRGSAIVNGSPDLATLKDLDSKVTLDYGPVQFDRAKGTAWVEASIRNISQDTLQGPLKLKLLSLVSEIGVSEVTNADNHEVRRGAIWDFSELLPSGKLLPGEQTKQKRLEFHLSAVQPLTQMPQFEPGGFIVVRIAAKALGIISSKQ